jgi:hypothetical protein
MPFFCSFEFRSRWLMVVSLRVGTKSYVICPSHSSPMVTVDKVTVHCFRVIIVDWVVITNLKG